MNILSIGEILWDVFPDKELIGGATFNFSAHARRLGHDVAFISAVGKDDRGQRALALAAELGLSTRHIRQVDSHPTGYVTVFVNAEGQPDFTIHRPAAYDFPALTDDDIGALSRWKPDWIYFGTLHQMGEQAKSLTRKLMEANPAARRIYDINLRKASFTPSLVRELLGFATVLKINDDEVLQVRGMFGESQTAIETFCRECRDQFGLEGVCVTLGAKGCAVLLGNDFVQAPGYRVKVADTVGSGDAFAAAFIHGLGQEWPAAQIADFANRVGALIASRPGAVPDWTSEEVRALSRG